MKNLISIFLLLKSALKRQFTWMDIEVAQAVEMWSIPEAPAWLTMIANLTGPAILPEAWADYVYEWKTDLFPGDEQRGGE